MDGSFCITVRRNADAGVHFLYYALAILHNFKFERWSNFPVLPLNDQRKLGSSFIEYDAFPPSETYDIKRWSLDSAFAT